jgi:hypothetical protein
MQLRTKALIIVTVVIALLFLVMYVTARFIVVDGSGDLQARVGYFLLISFAAGLTVAYAAVFLIEKIGISLVYNMGEAGAKRLWKRGVYKTDYSKGVIERSQEIEQDIQD